MNSKLYSVVKKYYVNGIYTKEDVELFLAKGKITEDEYNELMELVLKNS